MSDALADFTTRTKLRLYEIIATTTRVPLVRELAAELGAPEADVRAALDELRARRLVVIDPGTREIRMAPPFSPVPTPHQGIVDGRTYQALCVWDAFGVVAALGGTGVAVTRSGGTGEELRFPIENWRPRAVDAVFHYAVPAARWWEDIVFT